MTPPYNNHQNRNRPSGQSPTPNTDPLPYAFISIDPDMAVHDAPMPRDGSSPEPCYSGELRVTLKTLTPLFVGNHHHKIDDQHSEAAPERLPDGRVLIAGSSLKGMIRSALSGLLSAPMSQVTEHHYTYRPNLGFGPSKDPRREVRAAIVEHMEGEGASAKIKIRLLPNTCPVVFVRDEARASLGTIQAGNRIQGVYNNVKLTGGAPRERLMKESGKRETLDHYYFDYCGGMDGAGHLARAFNSNSLVYQAVLIPATAYQNAPLMPIPEKVLKAYYQTQEILADDQHGHLSPGHPLAGKPGVSNAPNAILAHARLRLKQLVYLEITHGKTPDGKPGISITSMGHHFQYRWAYTSSVRSKNRLLDGEKSPIRPELDFLPIERETEESGQPKSLAANRLLFGYALNDDENSPAKGNWKKLAGRISPNTAIEVVDDARAQPQDRFINNGGPVTLRVLGMPRPSAVEFYVKQTALPNTLSTYGDTPRESGGDLAGRKYYRHQRSARTSQDAYQANNANANDAERGTVVRGISKPDISFRFTLRFDQLRPWELGALLVALEPHRLARLLGVADNTQNTQYAHKLGYGKPLGLGSVQLTADHVSLRANNTWEWQEGKPSDANMADIFKNALKALQQKLKPEDEKRRPLLDAWLLAYRFSGTDKAAYPLAADRHGEHSIYNYHTNLRRAHAEARRGNTKGQASLQNLSNLLNKK